jgi:peptidyl-dipeptidase Dcp
MNHPLALAVAMALAATAPAQAATSPHTSDQAVSSTPQSSNPFFAPSPLPLHYPQFDKIQDSDFGPAFDRGMAEQKQEFEAIADSKQAPTFDNTILAMERSGQVLSRASYVFFNLTGADTNDTLDKLDTDYSPKFAAHRDALYLNPRLFARVKAINAELAALTTKFSQDVLAERNDSAIVVDSRDQLSGMTDDQVNAAAEEAKARKLDGKFVIPLVNTTGQPSEAQLDDRALRERIYRASVARGSRGNQWDTREAVSKVTKLRAERAKIMGYPNYAAFAVANARREGAVLQAMIDGEQQAKGQPTFELKPWDWAYYTEKVRKAQFDYDESQIKPYLEMDNVLEKGVFFAANKLYGLTFKRRTDLPVYQPDVRVYDVSNEDGSQLALVIVDPYARSTKQGGAWMSSYVDKSDLMGTKPVVALHLNVTKPAAGKPALMTWDDANTAFHEFGHVLHGMFSDVKYPYFSGTNVPRDFVEFPSQVNEMWMDDPVVLANYARHWQTDEPMPKALLDKVMAASKFNEGFATTEYLGAAMLDQKWHQVGADQLPDAAGVMD